MRITIEKIIYPGKSLSHINGQVVFADEGIPGEIIEAEEISNKKNYLELKTLNVIEPSDHRVSPRCGHYKACSRYQYIDYPLQVKIKQEQIENILSHSLKTDICPQEIKPSASIWGYRNKLHLHVIKSSDSYSAAYHAPGSADRFIPIEGCFLASEQINSLITTVMNMIRSDRLDGIEEIVIRESRDKHSILLCCSGYARAAERDAITKKLSSLAGKFPLSGVLYTDKKTGREHIVFGVNCLQEQICGKRFFYGAGSFFQINTPLLEELFSDIRSSLALSRSSHLIDLYCGVGTFGIAFSGDCACVSAVESETANIPFLEKNIRENNLTNFRICQGNAQSWLPRIRRDKNDILVVDPPRNGLDRKLCEHLLKKRLAKIAYVSCNPSTLVRDLKLLMPAYKLSGVYSYDFFPHTPHIETLSILEAKQH